MGYNLKNDSLIIGAGGAGTKIMSKLIEKNPDLNYSMITASETEIGYAEHFKDKLVSKLDLDFDGSGKKPMFAFKKANNYTEQLNEMIKDYKFIFHLCGIGGGTGIGTAMNIAYNSPKDKLHIFLSTVPHLKAEGQRVYENTLDTIKKINQGELGRLWLFDNNYSEDFSLYKDMNERIVEEINLLFNLPNKKMITQDMDTGNVLDIIFSDNSRKKGIISMKKMTIKDFNSNIQFDKLLNKDQSVSYDFGFKNYDKIGLIVKLSDQQTFDENKRFIKNMRIDLIERTNGSDIHPAYFTSKDEENEIILLLSSPLVTNKHYQKYAERNEELLNKFEESFEDELQDELNYTSSKSKDEMFSSASKGKKSDPFAEENNKDPFVNLSDDEEDIWDF